MQSHFNTQEYVKMLGEELVFEFCKAGMTTHPHAVGGGRENSARMKLKNILPAGVGIGSGFVIDSFGNTSGQCDIILYEENLAMKFVVNDDQTNAYYNCESVIAVGEVKSVASMTEIRDAVDKLVKVKQLKRFNDDGYNFRHYLSATATRDSLGEEKKEYNSDDNPLGQIFTFIICQKLNASTASIINYMKEKCVKECEYVNKILSTDGAYISYLNLQSNPVKVMLGRMQADSVYNLVDNEYAFNYFIHNLVDFISHGISVPIDYTRYLSVPLKLSDMKEIIYI